MRSRAWVWLVVMGLAVSVGAADLASVRIDAVPHVRQRPDFCGEACLEMAARWKRSPWTQDDAFNSAVVDPALGRGLHAAELRRAIVAMGYEDAAVWKPVPRAAAGEMVGEQLAALVADLAAGAPSIVCMQAGPQRGTSEHFRLIVGYDREADEVIYHEPAVDDGAYQRMARARFLELWPIGEQPRQVLIRMPLKGEPGKAPPSREFPTAADLAQHVMKLKARLPEGFSFVVERPFIVIGDEPPATVKSRATNTVAWCVAHLRRLYFVKNPTEVIDIWLFKDKTSYEHWSAKLFGDRPNTPYGYYSPRHRALVMNIATGGGTLVHEIVHPFMRANFAKCPSWFDEGLASLYEQSSMRDGKIIGLTNWRLAGLQQAIRDGRTLTLEALCSTTDAGFYGEGAGLHYAMARYLCYYLQEQGLLQRYYHQFVRDHEDDPTGYKTLRDVLANPDMKVFQQRWERWVLLLKFR